jgi:hypothetical protein
MSVGNAPHGLLQGRGSRREDGTGGTARNGDDDEGNARAVDNRGQRDREAEASSVGQTKTLEQGLAEETKIT